MTVQQLISLALLIWNLVVFVIYGLDKGKARKQAYRIPEKTLMAMAIFFGGLGAWAGGHFFHHKTQKLYFKLAWLLGLAVAILVIYYLWR